MYKFKTKNRHLLGDLNTPVSIYLKLRDIYPKSALLESSDYYVTEESHSYIAICPLAEISVNSGICTMKFPDGKVETSGIEAGLPALFDDFMGRFKIKEEEDGEPCGLFGYTAFDAVKYLENIPVPEAHHADNDAPDVLYILYKYVISFNHYSNGMELVELLADGEESRLHEIEQQIANRNFASYNFKTVGTESSTLSDEEYMDAVSHGIKRCLRGDVFQVVLSRRFSQEFKGDDFKVYRALRSVNPSPYLFYFDFGGFRIFGSSPETHCQIDPMGKVNIDPIAGTTYRTGIPEVDRQRTDELLSDPKENAEHVMLVDLARNDLSRNAHKVTVEFYKQVQNYSHVIHLTSRVSGQINKGSSVMKTYFDTFPAGTLSGAPKVKAMEIITGTEPHNRGAYGGCIGFIGFDGSLNQAITIRSFVSRNNMLHYQAGAGIVAASYPERELEEVNSKLAALKLAINIAEDLIN